jgi:hypothetical protein
MLLLLDKGPSVSDWQRWKMKRSWGASNTREEITSLLTHMKRGMKSKSGESKNASATFNDLIRYTKKLSKEETCHQNLSAKGRSSSPDKRN